MDYYSKDPYVKNNYKPSFLREVYGYEYLEDIYRKIYNDGWYYDLLVAIMPKINEEKIKEFLTLFKLTKYIRIIDNPKSNSEFEINKENTKILDAFVNKGLIKSYEKVLGKEGYFKVKR